MRKPIHLMSAAVALIVSAMPASAVYNATLVGKVAHIQQMGPSLGYTPDMFTFKLTTGPAAPCSAGGFAYFAISSATINDAQIRKNMLAKAQDAEITVAYDNTGGFCDQGMFAVYYVTMN
jgi:hypothetical protein